MLLYPFDWSTRENDTIIKVYLATLNLIFKLTIIIYNDSVVDKIPPS